MPPESARTRVTRLLGMMSYLADRGEVPITELASHFAVSDAQVMKDLDLLWVTGLPGYYPNDLIDFAFDEEETSVALREAQGLSRPVPFAPREALAMAAAVEWLRVSGAAEGGAATALESVREKLRGLVPAELAGAAPVGEELRRTLLDAASAGSGIRLRYVSAEDETTERTIFPEALRTDGAHWYLDAWCTRAGAPRSFRMDRILALEGAPHATDPRAGNPLQPVPGGDAAAGSEDAAGGDDGAAASGADGTVAGAPAEPALVTVRLELHPRARWLAEEVPGARITDESAESLTMEVELARWDWLVRLLLGLGEAVQAVSPQELAAEIRFRAAAALVAYGERTGGTATVRR